ncbi:spore cortex biosynthesis protein YabQ [Aquibacillus kalidii]|uniref:spore cortex biosynthesis protein YabQ n=1 Tax=Aquibacillus kalidii TaxID=2762597 RepID=UPI00164571BF|nr:spore cortex biosynthesis protein YabQ [Aquibacillus kalidii]
MTLSTQFLTILTMIAGGVFLGAGIHTFRRFEVYWKKRVIFSYFIEICFWLLQTLILFFLLYLVNQGELRFYILIALVCGFAMFKGLLENMYQRVLEKIIQTSISIYHFFYRLVQAVIVRPLKWMISTIIAILLWTWGVILWIVLLLLKVVWYPISIIFKIIWRLLPKNAKKYLTQTGGFYSKIKNTLRKWWKYILSKRG